ncbi:hypothetical protein SLEP1_g5993 [Rubroshorea leprosula]|uniref:Uncharacterized protein n=1 Tax=Rubroshorea leprosula TaxID=152421 RepID=A0AAV5I1V6_9ROSI|nr:hypothetical protein SLEP1_g5993 [Rubroshorea leprosula]
MSLVDYASSSDDDDEPAAGEERREQPPSPPLKHEPLLPPNPQASRSSTNQGSDSSPASIEKLPDASLLLNSPSIPVVSGSDHASRVAAALAESASRKRDSNGLQSNLLPRPKLPRGALPHSKGIPDTVGGMLVPPQLSGRSNVVTEDISKLFVGRHADSQPRTTEN